MNIYNKLINKLRNYLIEYTTHCIVIEKREMDYEAFIENDYGIYGQGDSPSKAVYDLLNMNTTDIGLPEIKYNKTKWDSR